MSDNPSTPVVEHPTGPHPQDPSPLVTQMVQREVAHLQELRRCEVEGLRRELVARLDAMDKALAKVEQFPTEMDMMVSRLRELFEEKFISVELRFEERDKHFRQSAEASRELLREQRVASDIAISKSEISVRQQLDTQTIMIRDMKEHMDRTEGKSAGGLALWAIVVAAVMVISSIVSVFAVVMAR